MADAFSESSGWWDADEESVAGTLCSRAKEIENILGNRYSDYGRAYSLYSALPDQAGCNIVAEAVDSLAAELTQSPVRVAIAATAADWEEREKARRWGWYADAAYKRHRLAGLQYLMVRDALIAGIGYFLVDDTPTGPCPVRVHPADVLIDDAGVFGTVDPPEVIVRRRVSRWRLMAMYGEHAEELRAATSSDQGRDRDVLDTYLGWWDADEDGRMVVACSGVEAALVDQPWEGGPPWGYLRILPPTEGLVGESLALRAEGLQDEHDKLSARVRDGADVAVPRLLVREGSVDVGKLDDEMGGVYPVVGDAGTAIHQHVPQAAHPETYQRLAALRGQIFNAIQANELFAAGEVPKGFESGVAIRNYREVRNRRHLPAQRELEWASERLVRELVRGEQRASESGSHRVTVQVSGRVQQIALSEMLIDEDQVQIQARAASALPLEPSSRIALLQGLVKEGLLTPAEFYSMCPDIIDFEAARRRVCASSDAVEAEMDGILHDGEARQPEKCIDGVVALPIVLAVLHRAKWDGVSEDRLALIRQWLDELVAQTADRAAAAAAAAAPPPGAAPPMPAGSPPALPGAPPV